MIEIVYVDGSILKCSSLYFSGPKIIADDIYTVSIDEIDKIQYTDEE